MNLIRRKSTSLLRSKEKHLYEVNVIDLQSAFQIFEVTVPPNKFVHSYQVRHAAAAETEIARALAVFAGIIVPFRRIKPLSAVGSAEQQLPQKQNSNT